jgi:electron-transferring-flavoprotein dehydrogenase
MEIIRDTMEYDVVVIGAGPSGLATAIKLKKLAAQHNAELSICILEKGSEVGAHIISGCVMNPLGLSELIPEWRDMKFPVTNKVTSDETLLLSKKKSYKLPVPRDWQNHGNYIISLGQLCRKLAEYAESLGVEIYPGFTAATPIIDNGQLKGVITGDMGLEKDGSIGDNFQAGMEIRAKQTIIAEGCRGSFAKQVNSFFKLDKHSQPQTYGLGIKEIWRIKPELHQLGRVTHTLGYPLNNNAYGGGFIYHLEDNLISIGLVTALDYKNPYLSPFDEFQKFKLHPEVSKLLQDAERVEYGARTVSEGGIQALPKLSFKGGVLVGDTAGFLNVPKIKGVHNSIKSGILAAEAVFEAITQEKTEANRYKELFEASWLYKDLYQVRNIRPAFHRGLFAGILYTGFEKFILRGFAPWTFDYNKSDSQATQTSNEFKPIEYAKYDNKITFDRTSSVHLANLTHNDEQPSHLKIVSQDSLIENGYKEYASPETKFCPGGVYEIIKKNDNVEMLINAQNCLHCKACDIKTPNDNIRWTTPEGGSGPQYSEM